MKSEKKEKLTLVEYGLLLDFYGQVLSENQQNCLDLYYNQDLSITEISEDLKITRQAVHDSLKNGRARLEYFEEKLGLAQRFEKNKQDLIKVKSFIEQDKNDKAIEVLNGVIENGI